MIKRFFFLGKFILLFIGLISIEACRKKSDYETMVTKELEKGIRKDSLFLGIHLGMPSKEFYGHCWKLNKQKLVHGGSGNRSVEYELKGLKQPAKMNFYPNFHDEKIYEMPVVISYTAWAPWNKKLWSDSLQLDVVNLFEKWYGSGFLKIQSPKDKNKVAYVKVDGNRRISIYKANDSEVSVLFTDLLLERELKKEKKS